MMWHGSTAKIPFGWHLCDGTLGTPDLRNKFVPCAGDTYNPDDAGGADTHQHAFTTDGHNHAIPSGIAIAAAPPLRARTTDDQDAGYTAAANHRPQYYALCYIMKL